MRLIGLVLLVALLHSTDMFASTDCDPTEVLSEIFSSAKKQSHSGAQSYIQTWKSWLTDAPKDGVILLPATQELQNTLELMEKSLESWLHTAPNGHKKKLVATSLLKDIHSMQSAVKSGQALSASRIVDTSFQYVAVISEESKVFGLKNKDYVKVLEQASLIVPSSKELSIREFNDLSPYPIYPLGITSKPKLADGKLYSPLEYLHHDEDHLLVAAGRRDKNIFEIEMGDWKLLITDRNQLQKVIAEREEFYRRFRTYVDTVKDAKHQTGLDLVWFWISHEESQEFTPQFFKATAKRYSRLKNDLVARMKKKGDLREHLPKDFEPETDFDKSVDLFLDFIKQNYPDL